MSAPVGCSSMAHIRPSKSVVILTVRMLIKDINSIMMICSSGVYLDVGSDDDKVLTLRMIRMMVPTVAGGGGAILDDDILSPESEAGRS